MVQTKSILLIILLMFYTILGKRQLTDYQRIQMLAKDIEAITYRAGGAAELQEYLDEISSFSVKTGSQRKHLPELKNDIQKMFDVRYRVVKNLKKVVEETYRNKMDNAESVYVDCCKLTNNDISMEGDIFPFKVDSDKMCLFSTRSDEDMPPNEFPLTEDLLKTFQKNAMELTLPTWQYYLMKTGHLVTYPATPVADCDTFKHTFETLYADICHARREIVVVIDSSSRMSERTWGKVTHLDFAKEVAKTIVKFSIPTDRVTVVTLHTVISTETEDDENCFTYELALATSAYHEELSKLINNLQATGKSSYLHGLETATELLLESEWKENKIIVFISAVEPEDDDFIAKFNHTYYHSPVTIYTIDVGNSLKVQKVLEFMSSVSPKKPGLYIHIDYEHTILEQLQVYRTHAAMPTEAESLTPSMSPAHQDPFQLGVVISIRQHIFHDGNVAGAVGVDLRIMDLLHGSPELKDGINTYLFMFNTENGATLLHPLIRDMYSQSHSHEHRPEPTFVNIRIIEMAASTHGLLDRIASRQPGQRNITTTRLIAFGDTKYQGVRQVAFEARYSWMPIDGTPLAVCLVEGEHEDKPAYHLPRPLGDLPFLYAKHITSNEQCRSFGRMALKDDTAVLFTSQAFRDPAAYLTSRQTRQRVQLYRDIVMGKSSEPLLKDGIIDLIAISKLMHDLWLRPHNNATVTVWRYVYLLGGVLRVCPAIELPDHFETKGRVWYRNAIGLPGISVISIPYLDYWGGGYVITVSHTVYAGDPHHKHTEGDTVFAITCVDITIEYFQFLIQELFAECMNETYSCFAIDLAGYVIMRQTMLDPPLRNSPHKVEDIHITDAEPVISKHMLENGYMGKESCYEFTGLMRLYTYNVFKNLQVDHMDESPHYKLWHVPKTNVFILIKYKEKHAKKTIRNKYENCHHLLDFSRDGPCYVDSGTHICPKTSLSSVPWLPCTPDPETTTLQLKYVTEDDKRLKKLNKCFNYRCREKRHRQECHMMVGCRWCEQNTNGVALSHPFCGEYDKCYHGRIRFPSPYPAPKPTRIGLILFFTVLCASAIAVPFGYLIFRYQLTQEERRMTIDDDVGVTGTAM